MGLASMVFVLSVVTVRAQLNFDGDPLTENNVYTAEESQFSMATAKQKSLNIEDTNNSTLDSYLIAAENSRAEHPQELRPIYTKLSENLAVQSQNAYPIVEHQPISSVGRTDRQTPRIEPTSYRQPGGVLITSEISPEYSQQTALEQANRARYSEQVREQPSLSEMALNTFLKSKTPTESQMALEYYLNSKQRTDTLPTGEPRISDIILPQQQQPLQLSRYSQHQAAISPWMQQSYNNVGQQLANSQGPQSFADVSQLVPSRELDPSIVQARNNSPPRLGRFPMYRRPLTRFQNKPLYPQSKIGSGFYNAGPPLATGKFQRPVEVIYTKPPGFGHKAPHISNPPVPYEDANNWFPDADYPPPDNNLYYSQLYAQSYDPHYYNYIAKTGKIKPHLYGKLGKHDDGILAELFRGFKKHGLKNMMTPTFLLGMTIPALTLLLSTFIQKRSLGRSDSDELVAEEQIREYLERVEKAVRCYEKKARENVENGEC